LTVLADPFWGRLPWQLKRRGGNTASTEISWPLGSAGVRPRDVFCKSVAKAIDGLISNDI